MSKENNDKNGNIENENSHKLLSFSPTDKENDQEDNFVYLEGGWGWLVVIGCGYCFGVIIGLLNDYGLIYNQLIKDYNNTENHVLYASTIGSLSTGLQFILCPFGSIVCDLYGPLKSGVIGGFLSTLGLFLSALITDIKMHLLSYGIIFGTGQAFMLASTLAILPHYFNKKLGLANGLMNFVAAIIVVILPITTVNFVTIIMALSYRPVIPNNDRQAKLLPRLKESFGLEVFKNREYNIWCIASFIGMYGYLIPLVCLTHFSEINFPGYNVVILNIAFGLASAVGAISFGKLGDITKFNRVHYHTGLYIVYGTVLITIPFTPNFPVLVIESVILGFMDGILLSFVVPISYDLCGKSSKLANQAAGYYHAILGPTSIAGPIISAVLYEKNKNYDLPFYLGGLSCIICSIVLIVFIFPKNMCKKKKTSYKKPKDSHIVS